ncbi:MAG TPA: ATP-binding protein [Tepidisphaeraceae bacterium]|jgi:heavy metal sensor kinase
MTHRIAITILLTVWAAIVCAGSAAWLAARQILLSEMDWSIQQRAVARTANADLAAALPQDTGGDRCVITDGEGRTLDRQAKPPPAAAAGAPALLQVLEKSFVTLPEGRFRRLTLRTAAIGGTGPVTIVYSSPTTEFDRALRRLTLWLVACGVVAGAAAAALAAALARVALRPLRDTADVIAGIDESRLDQRIDESSLPPELRPMAAHLNGMIERLGRAFEQRRRFLADASHELRTPVAAMITTMEVCLRRPRPAAELTEALETCLTEARHMRQLVQALLRQVRAEGGSPPEEIETFDAARTVSECTELTRPLGAERHVRVIGSVSAGALLPVRGEPGRLRSVVLNLVSNAIEYNRPGGTVEVSASRENGHAQILVKDDGPGIAAEHLPHLFQPFYRASTERSADGHLGLGLFLVESHVKALGGECRVESALGAGTTFRIQLPCAEGSATAGVQ